MKIKNAALINLDEKKTKSEAPLQSQNMILFFLTFLQTSYISLQH